MIKKFLDKKNLLGFELSGKLTDEDYQRFVPDIERSLKKNDKLKIMVKFKDFKGWDLHALWDDIKFDINHFNDFEKIAMVGEKRWQQWMSIICKPFTMAKVKYFDKNEYAGAMVWLQKETPPITTPVLETTPY